MNIAALSMLLAAPAKQGAASAFAPPADANERLRRGAVVGVLLTRAGAGLLC